jgi:hypothetical protein
VFGPPSPKAVDHVDDVQRAFAIWRGRCNRTGCVEVYDRTDTRK